MLIVVSGPAGGGKTTFAKSLEGDGVRVISTDDFIGIPWDEVSSAVAEAMKDPPPTVVIEGVRAISSVYHLGLIPDVVYWVRYGRKPRTKALESRQIVLLKMMGIVPIFVPPLSNG